MSDSFATVAVYREFLLWNRRSCQQLADRETDRSDARDALPVYDRMLGILDAMTPSERDDPFERINAGRIRRIAEGAGTRDQNVLAVLYAFRDFREVEARGRYHQRCGGDG